MAIKIQTTKGISINGIKAVIYGQSGVGKTMLSLTAPRPIIISAERGLLSLASHDVPFIEVSSTKDIADSYDAVKNNSDYDTIYLDSLSEITETVLTDYKKGVADGRQAYMKLAESIGALIRNFRNLSGKHVIFVAKQKRIEDEDTGTHTFEPYLPGRVLPFQLPYLVDEVWCMRMRKDGTRYLMTCADKKYVCKDRSGLLAAEETADLTAIFQKISNPQR